MGKYRKLKKLAETEAEGGKVLFWRDPDGLVIVGNQRLTQEEFDDYCSKEFAPNVQVIVTGWILKNEQE